MAGESAPNGMWACAACSLTTRRCLALDEAVGVGAQLAARPAGDLNGSSSSLPHSSFSAGPPPSPMPTGVAAVTATADNGSDGSSPASLSLSFPSSSPNPTMTPWVQQQSVPTCPSDAHLGWHEPSTACEDVWSTAAGKAFLGDLEFVIGDDDIVAGAAALAS